jgi:hypothetical protein
MYFCILGGVLSIMPIERLKLDSELQHYYGIAANNPAIGLVQKGFWIEFG